LQGCQAAQKHHHRSQHQSGDHDKEHAAPCHQLGRVPPTIRSRGSSTARPAAIVDHGDILGLEGHDGMCRVARCDRAEWRLGRFDMNADMVLTCLRGRRSKMEGDGPAYAGRPVFPCGGA
jgi:hypothetical protein